MAPAPFKGTVTLQGKSGNTYEVPMSFSDVAGAAGTDDRSGVGFFQAPEPVAIVDIALSAAGTDTVRLELRAGGVDTGRTWRNASILQSLALPRLPRAAGWYPANAMLQLIQRA